MLASLQRKHPESAVALCVHDTQLMVKECDLFQGEIQQVESTAILCGKICGSDLIMCDMTLTTITPDLPPYQPPFIGSLIKVSLATKLSSDTFIIPKRHMTVAFKKELSDWHAQGFTKLRHHSEAFALLFYTWGKQRERMQPDILSLRLQESIIRLQAILGAPIAIAIKAKSLYLAFEHDYSIFPKSDGNCSPELAQHRVKHLEQMLISLESISEASERTAADLLQRA